MKVIAIAAVTAGGKTSTINELKKILPNAKSLHFDDYEFEGAVEDFHDWVVDGADYNVWNLEPLKQDILKILDDTECEYLLLDYPFAYCHQEISEYIDNAIFIDTPLDIAMARRELYEETGAIDYQLKPVCVYSVTDSDNFDGVVYVLRGKQIMLDSDLARMYQVETKVFNQTVKRNIKISGRV